MKKMTQDFRIFTSLILLTSLAFSVSAQQAQSSKSSFGISYLGSMQPLQVLVNQYGNGRAIAPANWAIIGAHEEGNAMDLMKNDKSMYAGYLNVGVSGKKAYNDPAFTSPRAFIQTNISANGKYKVALDKPVRNKSGLTVLTYDIKEPNNASPGKGVVIYQVFSVPGDINGYIIEMYTAQTNKDIWNSQGAEAIAVALSIRCSSLSARKAKSNAHIDPNKLESAYDKELGIAYAYDPVTGDNYWVNAVTDWNENGSQGAGYYKMIGNVLKKLSPGRSE